MITLPRLKRQGLIKYLRLIYNYLVFLSQKHFQPEIYTRFLEILHKFKDHEISKAQVSDAVSQLFKDQHQEDLLPEFFQFLDDNGSASDQVRTQSYYSLSFALIVV